MNHTSSGTPAQPSPKKAFAALLLGASAIAFAPIFVRLSEMGPMATAFWRLLLAQPLLWLAFTIEQQTATPPQKPSTRADYRLLTAAGFFFAGDLAIWHLSIKYTSVANATLLPNLAPIFVTLGAWLFFRQRVTRTFLLGLGLALLGAILLIGLSFNLSSQHLLGDGLGVLTAVFYGSYILTVKQLRHRFSALTIMAWSGIVASLLLLLVTLLSGESLFDSSIWGWLVLLALALFSHSGGQGLIAYALAHLPASFSSVSLLWQPVMAALLAWQLLGEPLGRWQVLGGVIVLAGIFLARRGSSKKITAHI